MSQDYIKIKGAREHNLKNISLDIPRDKLVVITGVSGSGKSSLAFDTIYAEGQRRYMESLSAYARQFLGRMEKPDVDSIEGLSPAISIDQKGQGKNPRSTVGTVTEVYDYLRLLFARIGHPFCPHCGKEISAQSIEDIASAILAMPAGQKIMILAPVISDRKGEYQSVFAELAKNGYARARVDGAIYQLDEEIKLEKTKKHKIEAVVDRLVTGEQGQRSRIVDSVETALKLGAGNVIIAELDGQEKLYSEHFACKECGFSFTEIEPRTFSFNSPHGACPSCTGLGFKLEFDADLVIPDKNLSLNEGAIAPFATQNYYLYAFDQLSKKYGFNLNTPVKNLSDEQLNIILYGEKSTKRHRTSFGKQTHEYVTGGYEGIIPRLQRLHRETQSEYTRTEYERYMISFPCDECEGKRLKKESLAVFIDGQSIMDISAMAVTDALKWVKNLTGKNSPLNSKESMIGKQIFKEITARLGFLEAVGLDYLSVDRASNTLSGGETQRIRLATQIGSGLTGVLYICDEPTVGLHPADDDRLINTLKNLTDLGNTVIVVEHDEAMMRAAHHIVDIGPYAGEHGGQVVAQGSLQDIMDNKQSLTGAYLSGRKVIALPKKHREGNGLFLSIVGATQNNLKNVSVDIPLGKLVVVTGVSGSGKSTLITDILYKSLAANFYRSKERPGIHQTICGMENINKVINIDQSPIGRTPRSNPATYTGIFTVVRDLFAKSTDAKTRGYMPGRFSFNVKGGRCEECKGDGYIQIEMQFLPDVTVPCEVCGGKRYNAEVLEVKFKGKNIADVLDMTIEQALEFFANFPAIHRRLQSLNDVGLGYMRLGQSATTLSGGEAQRIKLATELAKTAQGHTLYILDEPTTGLAFEDTAALLRVLNRLADNGSSVLVIEHQLDIIKNADYIIDLGPGAGHRGGQIVALGTPEEVANNKKSLTGCYLKPFLV
ncbi:MAG: excinuclease ABC subunit UvrA [Chloroflexi bacterium]|nr:excinuclease ABC subunit UvrA [Chloroflexota bacterium]